MLNCSCYERNAYCIEIFGAGWLKYWVLGDVTVGVGERCWMLWGGGGGGCCVLEKNVRCIGMILSAG